MVKYQHQVFDLGSGVWCPIIKSIQPIPLGIGEYSARKIYFFPGQQKNCEKISPYVSLSEVENCPKLQFLENNCQD